MNVRTTRIPVLAAATIAAAAAATGAALTVGAPQLLDALDGRSEALDQHVVVGEQPTAAGVTEPVWQRALRLRSEALDRQDGLAGVAVTAAEPVWQRALRLRSEALDRQYGLGR